MLVFVGSETPLILQTVFLKAPMFTSLNITAFASLGQVITSYFSSSTHQDRDHRLYLNEPGNMADAVDLPPSQTHWQDVSAIPTTQFQQSMLAVMYLVAAVAYLTYGLRMYSRISSKQTGLGKYEQAMQNLV